MLKLTPKNILSDELMNLLKGVDDWKRLKCSTDGYLRLSRSLLEGYVKGHLELRLHLRDIQVFGHASEPADYLATFKWPTCERVDHLNADIITLWQDCVLRRTKEEPGKVQHAMLVDVAEIVKNPEVVILGSALPSDKRLYIFNGILRSLGHPFDLREAHTVKFRFTLEDGEFRFADNGRLVVGKDKLPGEVIKTGSQVVQDLANTDAPAYREVYGVERRDILSRVVVSIDAYHVRTEFLPEGADRGMQVLQVMTCPIEFGDAAFERRHELFSDHEQREKADDAKGHRDPNSEAQRLHAQP